MSVPEERWPRIVLLVAGAFLYVAYALITPPFQTPDEQQHLFRAWQLAHFQLHAERRGDEVGGMLPTGLPDAAVAELGTAAPHVEIRPVPRRPLAQMFERSTPVSDSQPKRFANFLGGALYGPVGYAPQIAALWASSALGWSAEATVRLGRLFNAALTLGLLALALTIMPVGRLFVLLLALMPMTAAMAASLGQDGLIIGSCAMVTALGLRAAREARWSRSALVLLGLFGGVLGLTKIVYTPLIALALLPVPRGRRPLPWMAGPAALLALAAGLSALWLKINAGAVVRMAPGLSDPGAQLAFIAAHPSALLATLARTLADLGGHIVMTSFSFGWLTVGPVMGAAFLAGAALVTALFHGIPAGTLPGRGWRVWGALIALLIAAGISTAIYIASSPVGSPIVLGLQGRYFLPLLPLLGLVAARPRGAARKDLLWISVALMLGSNVLALLAIGGAFYTA
jgi:uncharacterized membrane protein